MQQGYSFLTDGHNLIFQVAFTATGVVSYKVGEQRNGMGGGSAAVTETWYLPPLDLWKALAELMQCCRPSMQQVYAKLFDFVLAVI